MSESMPSPEEITKIGRLVGQISGAIEEELWPGMNPEDEQKWLRELAIVMSHYRVICNRKPG
jgi:hypothetical protein